MLKFLTHKLRTHSLNEDNVAEKVEERDSGTESDDEAERSPHHHPVHHQPGDFCTDVIMKWNDVTDISMGPGGETMARGPLALPARLLPDPEPDHLYDHHSSEEELEVINGLPSSSAGAGSGSESRRRGASSPPPAAPEKRKWPAPQYDADENATRPDSDDDDTKVETPVRFRTSPPLEALKPRRCGAGPVPGGPGGLPVGGGGPTGGALPPSPRRRRAPLAAPRRHRPALDFDKMQQLKVGGGAVGVGVGVGVGARSWRGVGGAGGELSVFCW